MPTVDVVGSRPESRASSRPITSMSNRKKNSPIKRSSRLGGGARKTMTLEESYDFSFTPLKNSINTTSVFSEERLGGASGIHRAEIKKKVRERPKFEPPRDEGEDVFIAAPIAAQEEKHDEDGSKPGEYEEYVPQFVQDEISGASDGFEEPFDENSDSDGIENEPLEGQKYMQTTTLLSQPKPKPKPAYKSSENMPPMKLRIRVDTILDQKLHAFRVCIFVATGFLYHLCIYVFCFLLETVL